MTIPLDKIKISIHSPRMGRDSSDTPLAPGDNSISIHSPRMGRDHQAQQRFCISKSISIHSPRMGRDTSGSIAFQIFSISIHSPRMGRDRTKCSAPLCTRYFNPLSPHGERPAPHIHPASVKNHFNPLSPHGERHHSTKNRQIPPVDFNPLSPHGERLLVDGAGVGVKVISIHSPRMGRDAA